MYLLLFSSSFGFANVQVNVFSSVIALLLMPQNLLSLPHVALLSLPLLMGYLQTRMLGALVKEV